jgi:hypothetical protein
MSILQSYQKIVSEVGVSLSLARLRKQLTGEIEVCERRLYAIFFMVFFKQSIHQRVVGNRRIIIISGRSYVADFSFILLQQ